mgnify:CR=1 FL=1
MSICAVILAGGSGTRLWPLSRAAHPKQFLALYDEYTMLQATVKRLSGLDIHSSITVCNEEHRFFVAEQLREINNLGSIILEPASRNTAPAIALAAFAAKDDPLLLVFPADHVIQDKDSFTRAVSQAIPLAKAGKLVTFGIIPTEPHIGYGYIKKGQDSGVGFEVEEFVEKPTMEIAKDYISSKNYFWNSGMFLFKASRYLEELKKFNPEIHDACEASMVDVKSDLDFLRINKEEFKACPNESVDYAVMEKTKDAVVMPMDAGWSDIGSWSSLWDISKKDSNGNTTHGDIVLHDSANSYIRSDNLLVTTIGIDNLVIVATKDVVLVANKDNIQDVKQVVNYLKNEERTEWDLHREVYRPWGKYDSIDNGERYQVKRITVKPGAKLSVQLHNHRAEHWIVVKGTAIVTNGNKTFELSENESTYIPIGVIHALENPSNLDLELIEVQSGSYLGEDDIVRFSDLYGRAPNQNSK